MPWRRLSSVVMRSVKSLNGWGSAQNRFIHGAPNLRRHRGLWAEDSEQAAEVKRLKRELARVTEERNILKKAAVGSIGHCNTYSFNMYGSELPNETNVFSRRAGPCI